MKELNKQYIYLNYNRKNKWLGIIDYKSLMFLTIYIFIIIDILKITHLPFQVSIYIFLFLVVPIVGVIFINVNNEVVIDVIFLIFKFYIAKGMFVNDMHLKKFKHIYYKNME